jgi:hypothetical protein
MELINSQTNNDSSSLSTTSHSQSLSKYLEGLNLAEEPLVGLLEKPMENYSPEEMRAFVQEQRALRESRQSFKAAVVAKQGGINKKQEPTTKLFDEF